MISLLDESEYLSYLKANPFHENLKLEIAAMSDETLLSVLTSKREKGIWESVEKSNTQPIPEELDDLIRLHYLVTSRRATTILEFGVGKSTVVFDHALQTNKLQFEHEVRSSHRRSNLFELHTVDGSQEWIEKVSQEYPTQNTQFYFSRVLMGTFNERICTYYELVPNVCPDLIYLDGPDQYSASGSIRGISTNHPARVPMAADILAMEHFLLPGTLIIVDGRTANARFLKCNLQRSWTYVYEETYDQHFFELDEAPLGVHNRNYLQFCHTER